MFEIIFQSLIFAVIVSALYLIVKLSGLEKLRFVKLIIKDKEIKSLFYISFSLLFSVYVFRVIVNLVLAYPELQIRIFNSFVLVAIFSMLYWLRYYLDNYFWNRGIEEDE